MEEKPILLVKLGDKGWIPDKSHFEAFQKIAIDTGLSEKFNLIFYHYGIELELLDKDKKIEDYGLQIFDEEKFKQFVEETTGYKTK